VNELRDGLWEWTGPHPDWKPGADWERQVRSFAHAGDDGLVLIDPLVHDGDWARLDELAERRGGVKAVAVTVHWHERDAAAAASRYGCELFAPGLGSGRESLAGAREIADGETLPGGVEALLVEPAEEALLHLTAARTLVAGDTLLAREGGLQLCPPAWLDREEDYEPMRESLARALEFPLEAVAVSHGEPALFERAALERALRA
jgi:glyoxylase-like metal-dependent hydrolase (beta-lactamase superfamily II)